MIRVITGLILLLTLPFIAVACGDDDDGDATPAATAGATGSTELTQQDENQISQAVLDYFVIVRNPDRDRLREMLRDVTDEALTRAMDRLRDRVYELIEISGYEVTAPGQVTVTLKVKDRDGVESTRTLEFERDQDQWKLRDPELH